MNYPKFHFVVVNVTEKGKSHAYIIEVSKYTNLLSALNIPNATFAQIAPTKREAELYRDFYNRQHKNNGVYTFDTSAFSETGEKENG